MYSEADQTTVQIDVKLTDSLEPLGAFRVNLSALLFLLLLFFLAHARVARPIIEAHLVAVLVNFVALLESEGHRLLLDVCLVKSGILVLNLVDVLPSNLHHIASCLEML